MSVNNFTPPSVRHTSPWYLTGILVVGFLIGSLFLAGFFLYYNVYQFLSNNAAVAALLAQTNVEIIDTTNFNRVKEIIKQKNQPAIIPANPRNIFFYVSNPTSSQKNSNSK